MFAAINAFLTRAVSAGYFLNKSLRFRSSASAYLNRTFGAPTSGTTWTWSGWVKLGLIGSSQYSLFCGDPSATNYTILDIGAVSANTLDFVNKQSTINARLTSTQVFRDPAAWYHIVAVWNTTSATATVAGTPTDRLQLWVNGVQISSFSGSTIPAQNTASIANSAVAHELGAYVGAGGGYGGGFDGEMAEVNFVDGQALAPTAFGAFSTYNQWLPKKYAGTYGTNGFYLPFTNTTGSSFASYAGLFNGTSQYLQVADNAAFAFGTNPFTIEMWVNPSSLANNPYVWVKMNGAGGTNPGVGWEIELNPTGITWGPGTAAGTYSSFTTSIALNVWTHLAFTRVGSSLTVYVNGVSIGTNTLAAAASNGDTTFPVQIGGWTAYSSVYFTGYISNVRVVKGTAVYTSNFIVPTAPLTAISGTSLLTLQNATIIDNSSNAFSISNPNTVVTSTQTVATPATTTALVFDSSGNANNWTPNNISLTAGSTYDSLTDVPTLTSATAANYTVWNPLDKGTGMGVTDGNLTATVSSAGIVLSTIGVSTGKWYWEMTRNGGVDCVIGIANASVSRTAYLGSDANGWGYIGSNGNKTNAATSAAYGSAYASGVVVGVALDMTAGTLTFYRNNVSQGIAYSSLTGTLFAAFGTGNATDSVFANFGQQPFTYTPPTGFLALNTYNI